jgi:hypothetical protein
VRLEYLLLRDQTGKWIGVRIFFTFFFPWLLMRN